MVLNQILEEFLNKTEYYDQIKMKYSYYYKCTISIFSEVVFLIIFEKTLYFFFLLGRNCKLFHIYGFPLNTCILINIIK